MEKEIEAYRKIGQRYLIRNCVNQDIIKLFKMKAKYEEEFLFMSRDGLLKGIWEYFVLNYKDGCYYENYVLASEIIKNEDMVSALGFMYERSNDGYEYEEFEISTPANYG